MSCFGATPTTPAYYSSPSSYYASSSSGRPWRWWRARCAGIAAAVGARLRRSLSLHKRMGRWGTRPSSSAVHHHHAHHYRRHHHHRSFAPVYVDDLYYAHHQLYPQPAGENAAVVVVQEQEPTTTSGAKLVAPVHAHAADASRVVFVPAGAARVGAATGAEVIGKSAAAAATMMRPPKPSRDAVALRRSPGGVLRGAVVKGMGEVDLRAELFIRKFKEDMRLQSQRSAEELQAMLARGL